MSMTGARLTIPLSVLGCLFALPAAAADPTFFNTGDPDGRMATATRPESAGGQFEIELADDFILSKTTSITDATFTGMLTNRAPLSSIGEVRVEIYRVFPKDSQVPPSMKVPTRVNSPSDNAFRERDNAASGGLLFKANDLGVVVEAFNSVQPGGIHLPTVARSAWRRRQDHGRGSAVRHNVHHPLYSPC